MTEKIHVTAYPVELQLLRKGLSMNTHACISRT